ncbi:hypothetical protein M0802_004922 [Mischocyttarus mexicanus]|nr:hypothetical protein M0802_004922 [Mischocyttarus mexicanus]
MRSRDKKEIACVVDDGDDDDDDDDNDDDDDDDDENGDDVDVDEDGVVARHTRGGGVCGRYGRTKGLFAPSHGSGGSH